MPALGVTEVLVGLCLVTGRFLRLALLWFVVQMVGTSTVFLVRPRVAFNEGNPLLLTVEGEFIAKNLVLLAAGMVVGSSVPPLPRSRNVITRNRSNYRDDGHGPPESHPLTAGI